MKITSSLKQWLPLAIVIAGLAGFTYGVAQQDLRQNADDPQVQLAEDAAARLAGGATPGLITGSEVIDPGRSLAPFIIVFDDSGKVVAASGRLDGATPQPPSGTLDYAKAHGQNRFTWQPASGVRLAAALTYYHDDSHTGYVLAARSHAR